MQIMALPGGTERERRTEKPRLILQVSRAEQLTPELAAEGADYLYVPAEILAAGAADLDPFRDLPERCRQRSRERRCP